MTSVGTPGIRLVCLHAASSRCDDPTSPHLQLFANSSYPMKLVRETLLQDIEVCATVVRPVRKAHLTNHHTKRPMAFYDWLTYARRQVAAQWTLNSNPHICTSSVASIISTDDIMNGHPNDADSWSFIATPKDRDTIG